MKKIKILLNRRFLDKDIQYISKKLDIEIPEMYEIIDPKQYDETSLIKHINDVEILFGPYFTESVLRNANSLKLIQVPWTGIDMIDFSIFKKLDKKSFHFCNSHSNSQVVAEYAFALSLNLIKKITVHDKLLRMGDWNRREKDFMLSSRLLGDLSVSIFGFGSIGEKVSKMFNGFGTKIYAITDKNIKKSDIQFFSKNNSLDALSKADLIIISAPLTSKTKGFFDTKLFNQLKRDVSIINVSRAEIVVEEDLFYALQNNLIRGYASDVWWNSPSRGETKSQVSNKFDFSIFNNILLSPHRAGFHENNKPHLNDAITNIINIVKNKKLINIINIEEQY